MPPKRRATGADLSPAQLREQQIQQRSLQALNLMRAKGYSLAKAAREEGVHASTVVRRVGSALLRGHDGRYVATDADRLPRTIRFITDRGLIDLTIRGSNVVSEVARYLSAVHRYLDTGDRRALAAYRGRSLRTSAGTYPFVTNTTTLERLAYAGEISFHELYAMTTGETK